MDEGLLKKLMSSIKCASCNKYYEEYNVEVLGNSEEIWFLQAICSSCHVQSTVVAIIKKNNNSNVVNNDDILNMHEFLEGFNGDFSSLFRWADV